MASSNSRTTPNTIWGMAIIFFMAGFVITFIFNMSTWSILFGICGIWLCLQFCLIFRKEQTNLQETLNSEGTQSGALTPQHPGSQMAYPPQLRDLSASDLAISFPIVNSWTHSAIREPPPPYSETPFSSSISTPSGPQFLLHGGSAATPNQEDMYHRSAFETSLDDLPSYEVAVAIISPAGFTASNTGGPTASSMRNSVPSPTAASIAPATVGSVASATTGSIVSPTTGLIASPTANSVALPRTDSITSSTAGSIASPTASSIASPT
ncbi:uncharacterized protein [Cherax quadricarinatus]